ncbi:MAG: sulfatase-like hydrolase/transferase, partial [Candidatus Binatia bacterium]
LEAARAGLDTAPLIAEARSLYDLDVRYLDAALERLWSRLDRDGDALETHVFVVADHGESFGEDGSMAHGKRLTLEELRVPCFIVSPRVSPIVHHEIASSIDVPATLYALAGITETPPGGRDLTAPAPPEATAFGMRRTFAGPYDDLRLDGRVHRLDFNLFYAVGPDGLLFTGNSEGMRDAPPGAAAPSPEVEHRLKILFGTFEGELRGVPARERHDPATEDALKALGYVG